MPNWCSTNYKILCNETTKNAILSAIRRVEQENELQNQALEAEETRLKEQDLPIDEIYSKLREKGLYRHFDIWLYYVLLELGYTETDLKNIPENIRGYIIYYDEEIPGEISLSCETAWSESAGFRHLLLSMFEDNDPDMQIYYTAEEPGLEVFCTNNPDEADTYVVDIENEELSYETAQDAINIVNDHLNLSCTTIEEAIAAADKHNDNTTGEDHIWIHGFEYYED